MFDKKTVISSKNIPLGCVKYVIGKNSKIRYVCKTCLVSLHVDTCYTIYHTKKY